MNCQVPQTQAASNAPAPLAANAHPPQPAILLVEDEAPLRVLVKRILQQCGYRVVEATSGVDALERWQEHSQEVLLLLTDMIMPDGMNGHELAQQLRAEKPSLKVVYTSGHNPEVLTSACQLREGINFLLKPYRPADLKQAVQNCLSSGLA